MSYSSYAPPWSRNLDAAADITRRILTPFFLDTTRAITAGTLPALITRPQETMQSLGTSMPTFMGLLSDSTAWHQANSAALTSQWTLRVLREQRLMVDACFEATTAVLDGRHNNSSIDTVNPRYLIILSTAFNIIQSWNPVWPSEYLLDNPTAIAALDRLLGKVLEISRNLPRAAASSKHDSERLIHSAVAYSDAFLQTIKHLPPHKISTMLAALPSTLLPRILCLADEQLLVVVRSAGFDCIFDMIVSVGQIFRVLVQFNVPATVILNAELIGLAKHLLVTCNLGTLPIPYDEPVLPAKIKALQETALELLSFASKLKRTPLTAQPSSADTPTHSSNRETARYMSVSDSEYFRALCICTASCAVFKANGNCIYANNLLQQILSGWRSADVMMLGEPQLVCVLSLIRFFNRQAQLRIQPLWKLKQHRQQQQLQNQVLFVGDNLQVQLLLRDACHILAAVTGHNFCDFSLEMIEGAVQLVHLSQQPHAPKHIVDIWRVSRQLGMGISTDAEEDVHACLHARLYPLSSNVLAIRTCVQSWTKLPGSAAMMEALLRDQHLQASFMNQHSTALAALVILGAPFDQQRSALPARISLAATLRKLMHLASAPQGNTSAGNIASPAGMHPDAMHDARNTRHRLSIISALHTMVIAKLMCIPHSTTAAPATVYSLAGSSGAGSSSSSSSRHVVSTVRSSSPVSSSTAPAPSFRPTYLLQLLSIAAATHVQLSMCAQQEQLGKAAYTKPHPVSAAATLLLQASAQGTVGELSGGLASMAASSWERFAHVYLSGRILPGCSHWGCTNLEGGSEASLPTRLCSGCRRVRYCCDGCQKAAWVGGHRDVCVLQK